MYDILYMHFSARKLCVTHDTSYLMWAKKGKGQCSIARIDFTCIEVS